MGYSLDLKMISIDAYKEILKNQYLLPYCLSNTGVSKEYKL